MDYFILIGILALGGVIIGFLGYKFTTESVIEDQEREISQLKSEIERYKTAYGDLRHVERLVISSEDLSSDEARARIDIISGKSVNNFEDLFEEF